MKKKDTLVIALTGNLKSSDMIEWLTQLYPNQTIALVRSSQQEEAFSLYQQFTNAQLPLVATSRTRKDRSSSPCLTRPKNVFHLCNSNGSVLIAPKTLTKKHRCSRPIRARKTVSLGKKNPSAKIVPTVEPVEKNNFLNWHLIKKMAYVLKAGPLVLSLFLHCILPHLGPSKVTPNTQNTAYASSSNRTLSDYFPLMSNACSHIPVSQHIKQAYQVHHNGSTRSGNHAMRAFYSHHQDVNLSNWPNAQQEKLATITNRKKQHEENDKRNYLHTRAQEMTEKLDTFITIVDHFIGLTE